MVKREDAMKVAEQKLQELAQALEQGRSQVLEDYLAAVARLHKYSFRNLMLIASQCPEAVHVRAIAPHWVICDTLSSSLRA